MVGMTPPTDEEIVPSRRDMIDARLRHPAAGDHPTTLDELVASLRRSNTRWARIALKVHSRTGIYVSDESLRQWYGGEGQ